MFNPFQNELNFPINFVLGRAVDHSFPPPSCFLLHFIDRLSQTYVDKFENYFYKSQVITEVLTFRKAKQKKKFYFLVLKCMIIVIQKFH